MSCNKQAERFGRMTGHTLRRNPQSHRFKDQFVITKRTRGEIQYEHVHGQFQEVLSDGDLRGSRDMVYSLNKQKRWEFPSLLKDSICNDQATHEALDFKVLLVERHLDAHGVFKPACTGLYESKTAQPKRLPRQTYADAEDLHAHLPTNTTTEALRTRIHKLRCAKNRGGKKVDWRALLAALKGRIQEERQQLVAEEERMSQLRYEVGYGRPESKYPWRPEMKLNTATSNKRTASTKQRQKATTAFYMDDFYDAMEDCSYDDIYEDGLSHSMEDSYLQDDTTDVGLIISEDRPRQTLGDALWAAAEKPKQEKRRKKKTAKHLSKEGVTSNQANSNDRVDQNKGRVIYDPDGARYLYKPQAKPQRQKGKAATSRAPSQAGAQQQVGAQPLEDQVADYQLPSTFLQLDPESVRPPGLEADFNRAYAEARCRPRKFAVQVGEEDLAGDPTNKVYLLFECLEDDPMMVECTGSVEAESWQVVKTGMHVRLTVYGLSEKVRVTSEQLSASFLPDTIFTVQDIMEYMQHELLKTATSDHFPCARSRFISTDIPTLRATLGLDCRFSTPDEAYRKITSRLKSEPHDENESQDTSAISGECGICYENISTSSVGAATGAPSLGGLQATSLAPCGHSFCNGCWHQYLRSGVTQGSTDIICPEYKCVTPVDPVMTMAFLSPAQFHAHYRRVRDVTLARSTEHHQCPNALCGRVACLESDLGLSSSSSLSSLSSPSSSSLSSSTSLSSSPSPSISGSGLMSQTMMVRCDCSLLWCSECREEGHWPASCQQAREFRKAIKKRLKDPAVPLITHVEVKHCPGCKTRWEKNGGCPSMICGTCGLNFCWLCLGNYSRHDYALCRVTTVSLQKVKLHYKVPSRDRMLELAIEHHKNRQWKRVKKDWFALKKLASRATMACIQGERSGGKFRTSQVMSVDVVMATATPSNHYQPLTWAQTKEQLEMMNRRAEETFEIAAFCHECHFVLEHLTFLLGSLPRRQKKGKWLRAMERLGFIVKNLQQTLDNVPNIKLAESEFTMNRLCRLMHAGKAALRMLALSMPAKLPQGCKIKE